MAASTPEAFVAPPAPFAAPEDLQPRKAFPPIEGVENAELTGRDLQVLIAAAVRQQGLVGHNLDGYDELVDRGLNRIMAHHFQIERRVRNERTQTAEDRARKAFRIRIQFSDIRVGSPVCANYLTGQFADMYPGQALLTGHPYSGAVTLGATVRLQAFGLDGRVEEKVAELAPFQIGGLPCMVRSSRCHTRNCTRETLKGLGEDPTDPGGYFVAKRNEYIVYLLENISYNKIHVHKHMKPNELARAEFLSQPGGAFENSTQVRVRLLTSGQLTVEINSTKLEKVLLPFWLVYRLLGMTSDREIAETIVFDAADPAPLTRQMLGVLERAFQLAPAEFADLTGELDHERLVRTAVERINRSKGELGGTAFQSNESALQFLNEELLGSPARPGGLDQVFLPHVGGGADRVRKLRFMGLIVRKLLLAHFGAIRFTDRDSYRNKRAHGAGVSLAKAFKTQVNNSVIQPVVRALRRNFKTSPWESLNEAAIVDIVHGSLAASELDRAMEAAITAGNRTIVTRRRAVQNRVGSQVLERKTGANIFSALRTVVTQNPGNASKQTERADMMRRVHPTYTGYICVAQSPDTGESVGMRKQLAITAGVCDAGEDLPLERRLLADPALVPLDRLDGRDVLRRGLAQVFVNGRWIGCCESAPELAGRYRALRREGRLVDPFTTIYWDAETDNVEFWLDVGRLRRPLLIVDNNLEAYDAALRARHAWRRAGGRGPEPAAVEFVQNVRLTPAHVRGLTAGALALADLVREGLVEYITPEEQENCYLAESIEKLRAHRHDVTERFTHCDVQQAIFGLVALLSPHGNHTQPVRITLQTNQGRQAGGWYALNFPFRTDKNRFFQFYTEAPLVRTLTNLWVPPSSLNVSIAYAAWGDNEEDSAVINQAAVDRGLFLGVFFRYESRDLEKGESFATPDPLTTKNLKPGACYEKLVDGAIRPGATANYGDVLVGVVAKLKPQGRDADEKFLYADRSLVYRHHEPAFVEAVLRPRGANDELFVIVKLRYTRPLRPGDKLCLTPDHDVLTAQGWRPIADVTCEDKVAILDGDTLAYEAPSAVHSYAVEERIYEIQSQLISLRTTLHHRMYVRPRGHKTFSQIEARHIAGKRVSYKRDAINSFPAIPTFTCPGGDEPDLKVPMDKWLNILGAFISDGWADKRSARYIAFAMTKPRKIAFLRDALSGLGVRHWYMSAKYFVSSAPMRKALAPLSVGAKNKRLPDYVWALSQGQARILLAALIQGDGHISPSNESYYTSSIGLAGDIQRLALHAGWSGTLCRHDFAGSTCTTSDGRTITATVDSWRVGIIKTKNTPTVNHGHVREQKAQTERTIPYKGMVHCLTVRTGVFYVRHAGRPVWTANSSRSGNKNILAVLEKPSDMPFTETGLTPDIIVNTHSLPTRMTVGQMNETKHGKLCARRGAALDGTAFLPIDHESVEEDLLRLGFRYNGRERMYNGRTGGHYDVAFFIGYIAEQRLLKFVADDLQVVGGSGPTDATTGQPLGGKHVQGGLRVGEMEVWCLLAQGATFNLHEKLWTDSSWREGAVCRGCGAFAVYNRYRSIYKCTRCGELADLAVVDTTKAALLFHEEMAAANVRVRLGLRPREFEAALTPRRGSLAPRSGAASPAPRSGAASPAPRSGAASPAPRQDRESKYAT